MSHRRDTRFSKACRCEPVDRPPGWMMRQAGRYQPFYRKVKEEVGGFWNLCQSPDAIAKVTLYAQQDLEADAAIIFSDITLPAVGMGLDLEFNPGPVFPEPIREESDLKRLVEHRPNEKGSVAEALLQGIAKTRAGLSEEASLIGFVGAPFTMAGYMIEGKPDRNWSRLKRILYGSPRLMAELLQRLEDCLVEHAIAQLDAGCDALQIFDSTAGEADAAALHEIVFPSAKRVLQRVRERTDAPIIYFARNVASHFESLRDFGADVIGVDWTQSLSQAARTLAVGSNRIALQGNLDPLVLYCDEEVVRQRTRALLEEAKGLPGYVFNLGHGILKETPQSNAQAAFEVLRQHGA